MFSFAKIVAFASVFISVNGLDSCSNVNILGGCSKGCGNGQITGCETACLNSGVTQSQFDSGDYKCNNVGNGGPDGTGNDLCKSLVGPDYTTCCTCEEQEVTVKCKNSGFDGSLCKGGINYYDQNAECIDGDNHDCGEECCEWGACLGDGNPCDSTLFVCTCEAGPYNMDRRNLRDGSTDGPTEVLRVHSRLI